jgi:spermidine synthase
MMGFLGAQPAPKNILMIGLGGGSLVKFCHRHLPNSKITVLEIDAAVIALREQFLIPPDDARLQVLHCDALDYLAHNSSSWDVILLDGFDGVGMVEALSSAAFFASCQAALSAGGVLVVNMWGKRKLLVDLLVGLRQQFRGKLWWCRSPDSYNLIVYAFRQQAYKFTPDTHALIKTMDIDLASQLSELSRKMHSLPLAKREEPGFALASLTRKIAELMATDPDLPRTDIEWSARHQ